MILRAFAPADAQALYELACLSAGDVLPREAFAQTLTALAEQPDRRLSLAFEGGRAVGFADVELVLSLSRCARVGVIHELYVREDARGAGVGSAMLVSLTTQLRGAGCAAVQASCARVNVRSQEFLERRGFVRARHGFVRSFGA